MFLFFRLSELIQPELPPQDLNVPMGLLTQLTQIVASMRGEKESTVAQMVPTILNVNFQRLQEQLNHQQQLDQDLNVPMVHLTQLIQIVVSMLEEKENTVAQMELTILNVNFQRPQEQLNHQQQLSQDLNVPMVHLILLIQTVVLTQEEKENIVAQMEPTIHLARFQLRPNQHIFHLKLQDQ
jgi:hypothetical protein